MKAEEAHMHHLFDPDLKVFGDYIKRLFCYFASSYSYDEF